ncbi:MAG: hypothetical protein WC934_08375 [Acidithiobacillus sp.]|jgi:hypothetical protein|uniref:hypothetical protein n=1 Tax=Acidithiobacillus sp. TaxID=1872118 RepID=UPI00356022A9
MHIAVRVTQENNTGLYKSYVKLYDDDVWIESINSQLNISPIKISWYERLTIGTSIGINNLNYGSRFGIDIGYDKYYIGKSTNGEIYVGARFTPFKKSHTIAKLLH